MTNSAYDVIIVGGSYAGLSAAMALGRSFREVMIIDSGKPCNRQTPHSHNFITHDGKTPQQISEAAKEQVLNYKTVQFSPGTVSSGRITGNTFEIKTDQGNIFTAKKILFATGVADQMPPINGFAESWGISILHCPYCHGYEVKAQKMGLIGNGDTGFEFCKMIHHWSKDLTLFTNGASTLSDEQAAKLKHHSIEIVETPIAELEQENGYIHYIQLADGERFPVKAIFTKPGFEQHCKIPEQLGCILNEQGLIQTDDFQRTNLPGIFAAGDNSSIFRAVSIATAAGTKAGIFINKELIDEQF